MNDDLISRSALKKAAENLVAGGAERLKDYYENGSKSEENEWIGGVYDVWELINNAQPVDIQPFALVSFDKDELDQIVEERVIEPIKNGELVIKKERPRGEWDYEKVAFYGVCSNCGVTVTSNLADMFLYEEIREFPHAINFCPNCGADMRKEAPDV